MLLAAAGDFALLAGFKWLTWCDARDCESPRKRPGRLRSIGYFLGWVGLDARRFLDESAGPPRPAAEGVEVVRRQLAQLDDACAAAGRDPASLARLVLTGPELDGGLASVEAFRDTAGRYDEAGVTDLVVHWPRAEEPYAADLATFERILSR